MSAMAAVAGATERMKFGMNVASVGLRDPLLLAKRPVAGDAAAGEGHAPHMPRHDNRSVRAAKRVGARRTYTRT